MANNVTSNEALPMHFDGIFKYEDQLELRTGKIARVQKPPGYQFFTCHAAAPKDDGVTLFASSRLFFRYLPLPWTTDRLYRAKYSMDGDGYWTASPSNLPLVVTHPGTGLPRLRWHQPWDLSQTKFSTCKVSIDNEDSALAGEIDSLIYDYRVCLRLSWETGDVVVNDNISMLHTRTAYESNCDRELWRIHCD
ncbi:hypothetical protein AnigIFM56816_008618 [Aspergillus niger]|nr:hypothetical protein AnigIFM56816_008618 [Aspergillus niger]